MPTFQSLRPYRNPLFQLRRCLPVWICLLNANSAYLCLFKEDFSSAIHPGTLCLLYMYLPISIIYSFYYIYKNPCPTSTSIITTISHDTASISTSNIYTHIQHPHSHPFQHTTSTSMHNIHTQCPHPHLHLLWNIYTCIQCPCPHPYLYILFLFQHSGSITCFRPHHLPHFDMFIFKVDIFPSLLHHELLRDSNII